MITIMTEYNDDSTLEFLATECEYEVELFSDDGSTTSTLCEGKDAGIKARETIDEHRLLADDLEPFPIILNYIYGLVGKIPGVGL